MHPEASLEIIVICFVPSAIIFREITLGNEEETVRSILRRISKYYIGI